MSSQNNALDIVSWTRKKRVFKNVVAQFIGRLCLINQATTKILGERLLKLNEANLVLNSRQN
ncbi:MAG: hypothetical protein COS87_00260 [Chloroflexi bacterium CG07_land_8_20_14_0_80_45_17]|nr:MAG: hypothetical protein COS87_00260 [Chloroflexi bacterium CG07_land_8_20_14_0_80_45_17]